MEYSWSLKTPPCLANAVTGTYAMYSFDCGFITHEYCRNPAEKLRQKFVQGLVKSSGQVQGSQASFLGMFN